MGLSSLKEASHYEVADWLEKELKLTPYQNEKLREYDGDYDLLRSSPFYFYRYKQKEKIFFLWRLTIIFFPFYLILMLIGLPFTMIFTGRWGYGRKFMDNFHSKWMRKIKTNA